MNNLGIVYALMAYFLWGLAPLFWRLIEHIPSTEIVAHRMLWSAVLVLIVIGLQRQWKSFVELFKQSSRIMWLFLAAILISVNWGVYIWSVNNGHIVEASMGYFINPLINVVIGVVCFGERLRIMQFLAVLIAVTGVVYLVYAHGQVPYIALTLAFSFGLYAAIKKIIVVPATHGMAIEMSLLALPALAFLFYLDMSSELSFGKVTSDDFVLILAGAFTLAPLLFFAAAAKRISMTALGMTQYLGPSLQLLLGVFVFGEAFGLERQISFGCIWFALMLYTADQLRHRRGRALAAISADLLVEANQK